MSVLDGGSDHRMERGSFGGECQASHCNQWGLFCIVVRERCVLPKLLWEDLLLFVASYCPHAALHYTCTRSQEMDRLCNAAPGLSLICTMDLFIVQATCDDCCLPCEDRYQLHCGYKLCTRSCSNFSPSIYPYFYVSFPSILFLPLSGSINILAEC